MAAPSIVSWAQNGEDVVLWRALHAVADGTYVDVGAHHPSFLSVTRALYDAGWSGVNLEPVRSGWQALVAERPRDVNLQVAAGAAPGTLRLREVVGTGLSTLDEQIARAHAAAGYEVREIEVEVVTLDAVFAEHLDGRQVHVLKVDVEGAEADVLAGLDLSRHRPWVLVVEATEPLSTRASHAAWEPRLLGAGYAFCLFDGLSRFYVADEHAERLRAPLSYPACALDEYLPWQQRDAERARDELAGERDRLAGERAELAEQSAFWRAEHLRCAVRIGVERGELAGLRGAIGPLGERVRALEWHEGLLLEEREWLRGLLEQERAREPDPPPEPPLDVDAALAAVGGRRLLREAARRGVHRAEASPQPVVRLPLRLARGVSRRLVPPGQDRR